MSAAHRHQLVHLQCPQCQEIVRHLCGGHDASRGSTGHAQQALRESGSHGDAHSEERIEEEEEEEECDAVDQDGEWELDPTMVERFARTAERLEKRRRERRAEQRASGKSLSGAGKPKKKKKKKKNKTEKQTMREGKK